MEVHNAHNTNVSTLLSWKKGNTAGGAALFHIASFRTRALIAKMRFHGRKLRTTYVLLNYIQSTMYRVDYESFNYVWKEVARMWEFNACLTARYFALIIIKFSRKPYFCTDRLHMHIARCTQVLHGSPSSACRKRANPFVCSFSNSCHFVSRNLWVFLGTSCRPRRWIWANLNILNDRKWNSQPNNF